MTEKLQRVIGWARDKLRPISISGGAMKYIVWYALLLMFCCTLYVWSWLCDWHDTGRPNLIELRNFLHEIASSAWVAVIGFVAKSFVDKDNDGIPDEYESEDDKHDERGIR